MINGRELRQRVFGDVGLLAYAVVLAVSLTWNVRLAREWQRPATLAADTGFRTGSLLPALPIDAPKGVDKPLAFKAPTVVYVMSPTCAWTRRDYQNLIAIHAAAKSKYEFIGVTVDKGGAVLPDYLASHPFPGRVVTVAERNQAQLDEDTVRRLNTTPQLLILDADGRIQRSWVGALFDVRQREAEDFFGVKLPGAPLSDSAAASSKNAAGAVY